MTRKERKERIVNNLRWFRCRAGLTQAEVAQRSGLSKTTISYIDSGKRFPQKKHQIKIASIFDIEPRLIFGRTKSTFPPLSLVKKKYQIIICRWCGGQIAGLTWDAEKYELIVKAMPRPAKVHSNGFFYHEDCLKEKIRVQSTSLQRPEK